MNSAPDTTSASLFANRIRRPRRTAARVGRTPAAPTIAAIRSVASGGRHRMSPAGPAITSTSSPSAATARCNAVAAAGSAIAARLGRNCWHWSSMP